MFLICCNISQSQETPLHLFEQFNKFFLKFQSLRVESLANTDNLIAFPWCLSAKIDIGNDSNLLLVDSTGLIVSTSISVM